MNSFSRKAVAVALTFATAAWFAGSVFTASAQTSASTISTLMAQIQQLQAQLQTLQSGSGSTAGASGYTFAKSLTLGSKGADVQALQKFLNAKGYTVAASGAGSPGNETTYFGPATQKALAKFQAASSISPAAGYFGPITMKAVNAMEGTMVGTGTGTGTNVIVPVGTGLVVSTASDSPVGGNVAIGAVATPMLALNFTAGSQPVTVNSFAITRSGLSQDADLQNVYLYQGGTRLAINQSISNGKIMFASGSGLFTVPANSTVEIWVKADIANVSSIASHVINFAVASASDVQATATVGGTYPVMGNNMSLVSVTNLATLTFQTTTASTTINAGQTNNVIGQFTLTAGNDPVKVTSLRFTMTGSLPTQYVQNVKLVNGGTQVGPTLPSLTSNVAYFDLSSAPLMLSAGQAATLQLYADVTGGVGYYFQFTVQQTSDIQAIDNMYNVSIGATISGGTGFSAQNLNYVTVAQGGLVVNAASSTALYVVAGNTNASLGQFSVLASGDSIRLTSMTLTINGTGVATSSLNNVQVLLGGAQLGTTQNETIGSGGSVTFSNLNYIIPANTTQALMVQGSVGSGVSSGSSIGVTVSLTGQSQSNYVTVGPTAQTSPVLQVLANASNMTAYQNGSFGNPVVMAGSSASQIASFVLQSGQVNPVLLSGVSIAIPSGVTSGWLSNLYITVNGTPMGQTQGNVTPSGQYTFSGSSPVTVAVNSSVIVNVYASVSNGASTASKVLADLASISATAGNNAVTLTASGENGTAVTGQSVAISQGNVLAGVSLDPTSPAATAMGMGIANNTLAIFRLNGSASGPVTVTQMTVKDAASSATTTVNGNLSAFNTFGLVYGGQTLNTQQSLNASGTATFVFGTPISIPQNGYATVSLTGNAVAYNNATTSEATTHSFQVTNYVVNLATGASSTNVGALAAAGNNITVYRALVASIGAGTVSQIAATGVGQNVFAMNVGATAGGNDVYVQKLVVSEGGSIVNATTSISLKFFDSLNPSIILGTTTLSSTATSSVDLGSSSVTSGWDVPSGATRTIIGQITAVSDTTSATNNNGTYQISVQSVTWSDGSSQSLTVLPASVTLPIPGPLLTNLAN